MTLAPSVEAQVLFATRVVQAAEALPPDLTLISGEGQPFQAHRLILSSRSPFFLKMLCSGMREQSSGEVILPDLTSEQLRMVLAWMYGKEVILDTSSPEEALLLLELAKRWEMDDLCNQLSTCEACVITAENIRLLLEASMKHNLDSLKQKCNAFLMARVRDWVGAGAEGLPEALVSLSPSMLQEILENDELPVTTEEQVAILVLGLFADPAACGEQATKPFEELLLAIRWRLVPGPFIANKVMRHPLLLGESGEVNSRLLPILADAMQFDLLGGKAWSQLAPRKANRLRKFHSIPFRAFCNLAEGMSVKVVSDADQLKSLCKRCAPGARLKAEWLSEMKSMAGKTYSVHELREEISGVCVKDGDTERFLPYDALLLGEPPQGGKPEEPAEAGESAPAAAATS